MSPPKSCAVCGDKALGYNFNAVTCESCKAFFRRNALAKKQFTCPFNQNCEISVVTRRFCQKCRLKKCLDIGMKSENIMSEEDKLIKRRKIENNRAKRRLNEQKSNKEDNDTQDQPAADSSGYDAFGLASHDSQSCGSFESNTTQQGNNSSGSISQSLQPSSSTSVIEDAWGNVNAEMMTAEEMVEFIVVDPDRASQAISKLMRTPSEALDVIERILVSQKDALKLISHLIAYPGDALKIISKIMNSPFNALTVFTKFMSSPTDALEIISKIVSSPQDVLKFIRNLMDSPEDGLDIMNKFMNTPAEALRIINKLFNGSNQQHNINDTSELLLQTALDNETSFPLPLTPKTQIPPEEENSLLHSMLNNSPNEIQQNQQQEIMATETQQLPPNQLHLQTQSQSLSTSPQPQTLSQPLTPQSVSSFVHSPMSITSPPDMQYHNSPMQHDDLPSTSVVGLINTSSSPTNIPTDADFSSEHFDVKTFIQNSFPEHSNTGDTIESVLTEVIRIEFQAFNSLSQETRIKQEQQCAMQIITAPQQNGYNTCNPQQQPICAPSSVIMSRDLNEAELLKIRELKLASEALYDPLEDDLTVLIMGDDRIKPEDTHQDPKLLQLINLTAVAIKRLIKMAKKISAFRDMCQEDQVALLKGGCTEMMIMRSVMNYDNNRNAWQIPHTNSGMSNIRAEVLKIAKGTVYEELLKFMSSFDEKWCIDENIILIMCAIVLFSPSRSRVIHTDVIRLEQNSYYYLLRRYLESIYPGCEAKSTFMKLIQKVSDVERLNQFIIGVYLNVNPSQVEPLLREIFDIKNH